MRRILATLAVVALLFSAGSAWADSNSGANELFVEVVKLVNSAEYLKRGSEEKAVALEEALRKLNEIIDDHPSSDLAVKLITNQKIGDTSLKDVARAAKRAREEAERPRKRAERARKRAERAREDEAYARAEFEMTLKLAEQGDAKAQTTLGVMYGKGRGVPQNHAEAVKWIRKAAEQDNARGQANLAYMYEHGYGVPENKIEALKWYRKAAAQGHAKAKRSLGYLEANPMLKPRAKPAPEQFSFDELLKSVFEEVPEKPPTTMALANLVAKEIKAKVEKNWSVPAGVRDAGQQIVTIRIRLGRDGAVQSADILDDNYANDANLRTMAESARRAVLKASPFSALKRFSDDYDQWRDVTMTFRPPV